MNSTSSEIRKGGQHYEVHVSRASRVWACDICRSVVEQGDLIEYTEAPPYRRVHAACGLRARRWAS